MKATKTYFLSIIGLALVFLYGCSNEMDKTLGYWKSENEFNHITYSKLETIVIEKNIIYFGEKEGIPIVLQPIPESKDIRVVFKDGKYEGDTVCVIRLKEDNCLELSKTWFSDGVYIRTTKEDVEAIIKSPGTPIERKGW